MTDWPTVWIAAISGFAGIGGTWLTNRHTDRLRQRADIREDKALVRQRFEELFEELDLQAQNSATTSAHVLQVMQNHGQVQAIESQRSLGKVRSYIALYFPNCSAILAEYDADLAGYGVQMRNDIEGGMDQVTAVGGYALLCAQRRGALAEQLRVSLQEMGPELGHPVAAV